MSKLQVTAAADATEGAGLQDRVSVEGLQSSRRLSPVEFSLQLILSELVSGGWLRWDSGHPEEAIYVVSGELEVGGVSCPAGGAIILEAGVPATVHVRQGAELVLLGPSLPASPGAGQHRQPAGRCVHVVGPAGWFRSGQRERVEATWFADSSCPTCDVALFRVRKPAGATTTGPAHAHSADEIIYILNGGVRLGNREIAPGSALCIPANQRYTLSPSSSGYDFLNYRAGRSDQTYYQRNAAPRIEMDGALARGGVVVGCVRDLPATT